MSGKSRKKTEALLDLDGLDGSQKTPVLKAIEKVSANPLPNTEGGLGKPLGNHQNSKLAKCCKIALIDLGLRVVYLTERESNTIEVFAISHRQDSIIYRMAHKRLT